MDRFSYVIVENKEEADEVLECMYPLTPTKFNTDTVEEYQELFNHHHPEHPKYLEFKHSGVYQCGEPDVEDGTIINTQQFLAMFHMSSLREIYQ